MNSACCYSITSKNTCLHESFQNERAVVVVVVSSRSINSWFSAFIKAENQEPREPAAPLSISSLGRIAVQKCNALVGFSTNICSSTMGLCHDERPVEIQIRKKLAQLVVVSCDLFSSPVTSAPRNKASCPTFCILTIALPYSLLFSPRHFCPSTPR